MKFASRFALLCLVAAATAPVAASAADSPKNLYEDNCSACHQVSGKGIKGAFPTLVASPIVTGPPSALVTVILNGRAAMPAFRDDLSDADLAGLITYVRTAWGNKAKPVTVAEVAAVRTRAKAAQQSRGLQAH